MKKATQPSLQDAAVKPSLELSSLLTPLWTDDFAAFDRLVASLETKDLTPSKKARMSVALAVRDWMVGDPSEGLNHMEALIPYRHRKAKWALEAKIWRGALLSDFGDFGAVFLLKNLWEEAKHRRDASLSALAQTALLEAKRRYRQPITAADQADAASIPFPGLRALAMRFAGIPDLSLEESLSSVPGYAWHLPSSWTASRVPRLMEKRRLTDSSIFPHLPDTPFMRQMACATCDNRCCYDGVYVTSDEESRIKALRKRFPAYFAKIPNDFTEEGQWGFLFGGKRTKRKPHRYTKPDYPEHFGQTKCVLALPNGECAPQRAGADQGYHPWRFKPSICWKFPLIGLFNDNAMEKPHYFGEPDPHAYDDTQRGYLSFLPCAVVDEQGVSWKQVYRHELLHFLKHEVKKG